MKLDPKTYGNSQAAINLVTILEELNNEKITTCISRFLISQNKIIKELFKIQDDESRETLIKIYKNSLNEQIIHVPKVVYTHALNILIAKMRVASENLKNIKKL